MKEYESTVVELEVISKEYRTETKVIIIKWSNPIGQILKVQISNNEVLPNEVRFFFNDGIRLPYYRNILFDRGTNLLPSELNKYIEKKGSYLFQIETLSLSKTELVDIIQRAILDEGSDWCITD